MPDAPAPVIAEVKSQQSPAPAIGSAGCIAYKFGERPICQGLKTLTRTDAEQTAVKNNPRVSVGRILALAQHQVVRETRAAELPMANASLPQKMPRTQAVSPQGR